MTVDMPCDCTHPKDGHAGLAYACWTCDCKRYTPDIQTAAIASAIARKTRVRVVARTVSKPNIDPGLPDLDPDETTAAILAKAKTMPTDSASARLRRVEQERDELAAAFDEADNARLAREVDLARARVEREEALDREHLTQSELASARAELQQLRAQLAERGAP